MISQDPVGCVGVLVSDKATVSIYQMGARREGYWLGKGKGSDGGGRGGVVMEVVEG